MISSGFIVEDAGEVPKRDGYISPGVERNDSAGEFSNLTSGDGVAVAFQASMLTERLCWSGPP